MDSADTAPTDAVGAVFCRSRIERLEPQLGKWHEVLSNPR